MDNLLKANRVEAEIADWNSKEERLKKLFKSSSSIESSLLKEKLRCYENILIKYKRTKRLDERSALHIVKSEQQDLIRKLYPNKLRQFFHNFLNSLIVERVQVKIYTREQERNNRALFNNLQKVGFNEVFGKVERYMKLGQEKFTVPVSLYLNEKERLNHSLYFTKNEWGHYQFEGFKTALHNELNPVENRNHYFNGYDFNSRQAYNLLAGRAVFVDGIWKQFDLNDKNGEDNYRIKEFPKDYNYSIEKAIEMLPLQIRKSLDKESVVNSLKEGEREQVVLLKDGKEQKYFIDASPQFRSLDIFNSNLKKVTLGGFMELKTNRSSLDQNENFVQKKLNGVRKSRSL